MCMNQSRSTGCKHGGAFGVFECFGGSESARLAGPRMQMCGGGVLSAPVSGHVHGTPRASTHCAHQTAQTCGTNRTVQPRFDGVCKSAFCNAFVQSWGGGKHLVSQIPSTPCTCDRESRNFQRSECVHAPAEGGGTLCAQVGVWVGEQRASCRRDCHLKNTRNAADKCISQGRGGQLCQASQAGKSYLVLSPSNAPLTDTS